MAQTQSPPLIPRAAIRDHSDWCVCEGAWTLDGMADVVDTVLDWPEGTSRLNGAAIEAMDTTGALHLLRCIAIREQAGHTVELLYFQPEHRALLEWVRSHTTMAPIRSAPQPTANVLARIGRSTCEVFDHTVAFIAFIGEAATAWARLTVHPGQFRWKALFSNIETAGVHAIPIIALLSFLIGVVIAYQGGQQLKVYGANIFVVELVSLTLLRELSPLITAIIVAGRTGSAYTAQIGTMQVTEEIDALRTIGMRPMEVLVLPKLLALIVVLPLLTVFSDILSVLGGMVMANVLLEVSFSDFIDRLPQVVTLTTFLLGISKAPIFAAIIALVGCYQGFQVRGGADSVGRHTTTSVVQSIFLVIAADALFSVILGGVGLWH